MSTFRFIPLALALSVAGTLIACNTTPSTPMPMAASPGTAPPDHLAHMDTQTKAMQAMHEKMMAAKTPEERNSLMAEHMKSMQDGMAMMEKRMAMMQTMMKMMMDRMAAAPAR